MGIVRWTCVGIVVLAGCGGGGGGGSVAPPLTTPPVTETYGTAAFGSAAALHALSSGDDATPSEDGSVVLLRQSRQGADQIVMRTVRTGREEIISVAPDGNVGNGASGTAWISRDLRYVVFDSFATNLVGGVVYPTQNGSLPSQAFMRDLVLKKTSLISVSADGLSAGNLGAGINKHAISADGRYVVFTSNSSNLTTGVTYYSGNSQPNANIFLRDLQLQTTKILSTTPDHSTSGGYTGVQGFMNYGDSNQPTLSADGNTVSFVSLASNLVSGATYSPGNQSNIFVWQRATDSIRLLSRLPGTRQGSQDTCTVEVDAQRANISPDGGAVVFTCGGNYLVAGLNSKTADTARISDVYLWQSSTDALTLVSRSAVAPEGSNCATRSAVLSADERYVAFLSCSSNLLTGWTFYGRSATGPGYFNVFRYDLQRHTLELVSRSHLTPAQEASSFDCQNIDMSSDGSVISFDSIAENLVASPDTTWRHGPGEEASNAYVWRSGDLKLVSLKDDATALGYIAPRVNIASDGRSVTLRRHTPFSDDLLYYYEIN